MMYVKLKLPVTQNLDSFPCHWHHQVEICCIIGGGENVLFIHVEFILFWPCGLVVSALTSHAGDARFDSQPR